MEYWIWAILLLCLGILFLVMDVFIPSGGVLAVLSAVSVVASICVGYWHGPLAGTGVLLTAGTIFPILISYAIKYWPSTPLGRRILIQRPRSSDEVLPDTEEFRSLKLLIGKRGHAISKMLPAGMVEIEDRNYDALSEGVAIEAGLPIEVIAVRMNRVIVRPIEPPPAEATELGTNESLSSPIESLGLRSLDDPLT